MKALLKVKKVPVPYNWYHNQYLQNALQQLRLEYPNVAILYADYYQASEWVLTNGPQLGFEDGYVGNPEDYVDAAGYEQLLQNLAELDGARKGVPPASKSAVSALKNVVIAFEEEGLMCSICKEGVPVGEKAKKMLCGHGYHGDCIDTWLGSRNTWLGSRNTCPLCRFELPTDDPEYEEHYLY
ncbi:hypothetical protein IFM89_020185 [Coptis chinensis]|uniref:RING-type domain-containing protein n=1 Tax=Coptis chinensis TaxID=261450 RepID=A0A835HN54_9MAGN|nr:hypothetical protein IFM89_020185 [Coptis chinensis]